jgi:hypothetical protein
MGENGRHVLDRRDVAIDDGHAAVTHVHRTRGRHHVEQRLVAGELVCLGEVQERADAGVEERVQLRNGAGYACSRLDIHPREALLG